MVHFILAAVGGGGFGVNMAMEMHDSRVLEIVKHPDGSGHILFHAVVYRSEGMPGQDAQERGWQNVRMTFSGFQWDGRTYEEGNYASDGDLWVNDIRDSGLIEFPIDRVGDVCLKMRVSDDFDEREYRGSSISIRSEGDFELEHVWDAAGNWISA